MRNAKNKESVLKILEAMAVDPFPENMLPSRADDSLGVSYTHWILGHFSYQIFTLLLYNYCEGFQEVKIRLPVACDLFHLFTHSTQFY